MCSNGNGFQVEEMREQNTRIKKYLVGNPLMFSPIYQSQQDPLLLLLLTVWANATTAMKLNTENHQDLNHLKRTITVKLVQKCNSESIIHIHV